MTCKICESRRPRRFCPGVGGDICSMCCGTEREVSIACPLDCEFLREARTREKPQPLTREQIPHADIRVTESLLQQQSPLLGVIVSTLVQVGLGTPGAVDLDVREALDALVRTYRTLESGLYYESRPGNLLAAAIHQQLCDAINEYRKQAAERAGLTTIRDADVLGVLVFLQRTEAQVNNGRRRSRAFLDLMRSNLPPEGAPQPRGSSLVLP